MTLRTALMSYGAVAVVCYLGWLVTLSVELHRAELKLTKPVQDRDFFTHFGALTSFLWPLSLVVLLGAVLVFLVHDVVIRWIVRRATRAERVADELRKAS